MVTETRKILMERNKTTILEAWDKLTDKFNSKKIANEYNPYTTTKFTCFICDESEVQILGVFALCLPEDTAYGD